MFSKRSDEWETPQQLFDQLETEFHFVFDAAATIYNTKCQVFSSDSLLMDWPHGAIWLNPPYSKCRTFLEKARIEGNRGSCVVCLVPSRTDTYWWHQYVWKGNAPRTGVEVRFIRGRLKFGNSANSAPFPSVLVIFRQ